MTGRPSAHTPEIADEICQRIAGGESLRSICTEEWMPHISTVLLWVVHDREGFSEQYHASREAAGYAHADEALALRHELRGGTLDPPTAKVILDALKWGAERMAPKRHSQRQEVDHTSTDGSMSPKEPRELTDAELAAIVSRGQDS